MSLEIVAALVAILVGIAQLIRFLSELFTREAVQESVSKVGGILATVNRWLEKCSRMMLVALGLSTTVLVSSFVANKSVADLENQIDLIDLIMEAGEEYQRENYKFALEKYKVALKSSPEHYFGSSSTCVEPSLRIQ